MKFLATVFFVLALLHCFSINALKKEFRRLKKDHPRADRWWALLSPATEIETAVALWALGLLVVQTTLTGWATTHAFLLSLNFREIFILFVILCFSSSPALFLPLQWLTRRISKRFAKKEVFAFYFLTLGVWPLLGSVISEPAAMVLVALLIERHELLIGVSHRLRYLTLAILFVNISVGGTLSSFAAPPVLLAAPLWGWDSRFMFTHFGWKACSAVWLNTAGVLWLCRKELRKQVLPPLAQLLAQQERHSLRFSLLQVRLSFNVALFLAALLILGKPQSWWLQLIFDAATPDWQLFLGSTLLTSIIDNAALTTLATQVPELQPAAQYAVMAGAVTGGGLTLLANAPNLMGFEILARHFQPQGLGVVELLKASLLPTLLTMACFWLL